MKNMDKEKMKTKMVTKIKKRMQTMKNAPSIGA